MQKYNYILIIARKNKEYITNKKGQAPMPTPIKQEELSSRQPQSLINLKI